MPIDWLAPETRSILQSSPPEIATAIGAKGYSLLLVRLGQDTARANQTMEQIRRRGEPNNTKIESVLVRQLSIDDAFFGQFELSCSDCISAFVSDDLVYDENASYLRSLSREIAKSDEYSIVDIRIDSVPDDQLGRDFCWQFLGCAVGLPVPLETCVFRKKARLMNHWGHKCGVKVEMR